MKRINAAIFFIIFGIGCLSTSIGNTATITAASCSLADINFAISKASARDTVAIPAGKCTWPSPVSLAKEIKLMGSGIEFSNITCSSGVCVYTDNGSANDVRISGFTFSCPSGAINFVIMNGAGWRVDHCRFVSNRSDGIAVTARGSVSSVYPYGLVDSNEIINARVTAFGTYAMLSDNNQQHVLWAQNPGLGGGNSAVYIENNIFIKTVNGTSNCVDSNYAGRYVFRFNQVTADPGLDYNSAQYVETHSIQALNRASQRWEIYGNTFNNQGGSTFQPFRLRGGTGLVFNNSILGNWTNYEIALDNVRSRKDMGTFPQGYCDGTSNWDQNTPGQTGYACRDQIGYGYDAVQWAPGSAWNQVRMPAYAWNNKKPDGATELSFVNIAAQIGNNIQANRDYYNYTTAFNGTAGVGIGTMANRPSSCSPGVAYWASDQGNWNQSGSGGQGILFVCTEANTWTPYYTPFTYPHPLRSGVSLQPPSNLRIAQ